MEKDRIKHVYDAYLKDEKIIQKWSSLNIGNQIISEQRYYMLQDLLKKNNTSFKKKNILDLGCASGNLMTLLINLGANEKNISGIDIRDSSILNAKRRYPKAHFNMMDARKLTYENNTFDCIISFTLLSSVLGFDNRKRIISEAMRVLKPNGFVIYYDMRYNNPFNNNIVGINKKELSKLFTNMKLDLNLLTIVPPVARRLGFLTKFLYPQISKISLFNSHYMFLVKV